ncbi:MAG: metal-dependent transcriptional regulator [Elusimicrobia bacterium]|nr:metal-dependent transcriptional regulator [Elusimicrobiota bacterium]
MRKRLSTSLEDYLEAAYTLSLGRGFTRTGEISRVLKVSKPSANAAVKALSARGLLSHERYGDIALTPAGTAAGREIAARHSLLKDFFVEVLAMRGAQAELDACRAEHALSGEALSRLQSLTAFLKSRGRAATLAAARSAARGRRK